MENFFFWTFVLAMIGSGIGVIANKNPVASAMNLVLMIICIAGLFVLLGAYFLAAVQVLVYAGAVMVLFLFIIMLLDLKAEQQANFRMLGIIGGFLTVLLLGIGFFLAGKNITSLVGKTDNVIQNNSIKALGELLFGNYALAFEAVGVLLLISMIGVIILSKKDLD
ncbi:NADH dehydrogenase [Methylacidiphilum kamchatkense Kam1]|uniref:NADH-quinone oxidoreductase subunit J n=1 Tax=Methylacidiphilum kamchatkense Kam1 TaxID=1202785 RepID=A0A0C1RK43_9BACT|nr:NADH-quinone oxidoreductase subunit J [Methylacidiphilum kamchatkense]KIE58422.1 NADH dehydrogenase [Methylacidiphilum kamchatkense Kam1]QDQ43231.1 NADH:ubiquinone oxidoreductase subunit 6 (subunit J) [Methylacidiphilum kamchatkense Kam1]